MVVPFWFALQRHERPTPALAPEAERNPRPRGDAGDAESLVDGATATPRERSARLHYDLPAPLRDERCPVQARILSPSAGGPKLEALEDLGEDLAQLQQSKRGSKAPPHTAAEWKPRPRVGVVAKKPLGDKRLWRG